METVLKVREHLNGYEYEVVKATYDPNEEDWEEEQLYRGSLADCEAYIRLKQQGLLV